MILQSVKESDENFRDRDYHAAVIEYYTMNY